MEEGLVKAMMLWEPGRMELVDLPLRALGHLHGVEGDISGLLHRRVGVVADNTQSVFTDPERVLLQCRTQVDHAGGVGPWLPVQPIHRLSHVVSFDIEHCG